MLLDLTVGCISNVAILLDDARCIWKLELFLNVFTIFELLTLAESFELVLSRSLSLVVLLDLDFGLGLEPVDDL